MATLTRALLSCVVFTSSFAKVFTASFAKVQSNFDHGPGWVFAASEPLDGDGTTTRRPLAFFAKKNNTEFTAQIGAAAALHCAAEHVGENTVSWIRRRDYHLLTVGSTTYSSDNRFQVQHDENDWQLHIRHVEMGDEGDYECQISSHPPISLIARLKVVEASTEILGGPEKYLREGSSLRLVCVLRQNVQPPTFVFWYLNKRMINYDDKVKVETKQEMSLLYLRALDSKSSGNYSCVPSNARPSTIRIHVLKGAETPAAIQSTSSSSRNFLRVEDFVVATFLSSAASSSLSLYISGMESLLYLLEVLRFQLLSLITILLGLVKYRSNINHHFHDLVWPTYS